MTEKKDVPETSVWAARVVPQRHEGPGASQSEPIDFERLIRLAKALKSEQRSKMSIRAARDLEAVRRLQV